MLIPTCYHALRDGSKHTCPYCGTVAPLPLPAAEVVALPPYVAPQPVEGVPTCGVHPSKGQLLYQASNHLLADVVNSSYSKSVERGT